MTFDPTTIQSILVKGNYLKTDVLEKAVLAAKKNRSDLLDYLFAQKLLTKDLWGQAVAESFGIPYFDLNSHQPSREQLLKIPEKVARAHRAILFKESKKELWVSTDDPGKKNLTEELGKIIKGTLKIGYSLPADIDDALVQYRRATEGRFVRVAREKNGAPEVLDEMFEEALEMRASDIHFEPQEAEIIIRFRVDGVLQEVGTLPKEYYENILNRVKVQSHLRTDEHFSAQDGSLRHKRSGTAVNIRVSIIPTLDGEKIVMRILTEYVKGFTLDDLGLSEHHQQILLEAAAKPFGMILVVGPTGSGKTTTLYGLLKNMNEPSINITTIEDPVEYKIPGINHIQVNLGTNLTFAKGLRSIVRQDPDVIFLGEIRDTESAEIGVNAALTGHLLLSTFHANDAATAIPRLLDMGIERFLLASTLEVVIAQVLVRRVCENCRASTPIASAATKKLLGTATMYQGKGCVTCANTGYKGRVALYEFIKNTSEMQELILKNPSKKDVWELARKQGTLSMYEDGLDKVKRGITTLEEVYRVTAPPSQKI